MVTYLKSCSPGKRALFLEVVKLAKLVLVMPATNTYSELYLFSALHLIKTYMYLSSIMRQDGLVYLMLSHVHVHNNQTNDLDFINIANLFIAGSEHRQTLFGKFASSDMYIMHNMCNSSSNFSMCQVYMSCLMFTE